jgi:F-type H+-transporting ATPase subunit delta
MRPSPIARRYAEAAFDVARREGNVESWISNLGSAASAIEQPNVSGFFKDPNVTLTEKLETLERLFPGVQPHVMNLLRMLALRERMQLLPAVLQEFVALDREARGVLEARVTVARPYDESERADIARRLSSSTGKQVEVHVDVDPGILGGVVVRIGDQLIDASVAGRLERLRHELAV